MEIVEELLYVTMGTIVLMCFMFIIFVCRHGKENKKVKGPEKFNEKFPHPNKLFNDIFRYFAHDSNSD